MNETNHRIQAKTCCSCVHYPGERKIREADSSVDFNAGERVRCSEKWGGSCSAITGGMQGCYNYKPVK